MKVSQSHRDNMGLEPKSIKREQTLAEWRSKKLYSSMKARKTMTNRQSKLFYNSGN